MALTYTGDTLSSENFTFLYSEIPNFEDIKTNFDITKHEIFIFKNKYGFNGSFIHQLCKKNTQRENSFAWIFPLRILDSSENFFQYLGIEKLSDLDFSKKDNNIFFLSNFVYPAFRHLIEDSNNISYKNPEKSSDDLSLTDFYDRDTYVLILDKNRFYANFKLTLEKIIPYLYRLGFCYVSKNEDFKNIEIIDGEIEQNQQPFSNLSIQILSEKLETETYVEELFKNLLKYNLHSVMRFYLLYQVIELLINKIGLDKFQEYKQDLQQKLIEVGNPISYHEAAESIKSLSFNHTEPTRINILFGEKCGLNFNTYSELLSSSLFGSSFDNLAKLVYEHRNQLIHGYHNLKAIRPAIDDDLQPFNIEFEKLIVDVVTKYQ